MRYSKLETGCSSTGGLTFTGTDDDVRLEHTPGGGVYRPVVKVQMAQCSLGRTEHFTRGFKNQTELSPGVLKQYVDMESRFH